MDAQSKVLHLHSASALLSSVSPRLAGSARSRMLLAVDQAGLNLPDGFVSTSFCSACRSQRIPGDTASIRAESRSRKRRRTSGQASDGRVRITCQVCGQVDVLDGGTTEQKRAIKKMLVNIATQAPSKPTPGQVDTQKATKPAKIEKEVTPAKKKRKKGLEAMLAASKAQREKNSTSLDGSLSSFLNDIGA